MESLDIKKTKLSNALSALGFCLAVFIPFILGFVQPDLEISTSEKRKLATLPNAPQTLLDVQTYPESLASYYSDHFGFRDTFVRHYRKLKYTIGDSTSDDLTLGKDGWLFLGNTNEAYKKHGDPFGDVRNKNLYSEVELAAFADNITSFKAWLKQRGIEYVFVIAPNKHTIYFDKLPDYIKRQGGKSATDQLVDYLTQNTDVEIVDLRAALIEGRKSHEVYFKTDTHWNHHGANIAQYEIMKRVENKFPDLIVSEKFDVKSKGSRSGDLSNMLGVKVPSEENPQPVFTKPCSLKREPKKFTPGEPYSWTCEGAALKALIYKDSFFVALEPYFRLKFGKSTYIPKRATYDSVVENLAKDTPHLVIEEWVERKLPRAYTERYSPDDVVEYKPALIASVTQETPLSFEKAKVVYGQKDGGLKYHQWDLNGDGENTLSLTATGIDPIIYFPELDMHHGTKYTLHIKFKSDVKSDLRLFYSTSEGENFPFTNENSIRKSVGIGVNEFYIEFSHPNMGRRLRLDLISKLGTVEVSQLELRQH